MSEFDPKRILNSLPLKPGVYQMLGQDDEVLYVGKAKKLKNRVSSYFRASGLNTKTMALVSHIRDIQVTVDGQRDRSTGTRAESDQGASPAV